MAHLVERATSDMLSGPDWAMNMELCDLINTEPAHAKDAVKVVKKRLGNKKPKVQLLALTVLETMVKNCGDYVHHQVAAKDVLHEMVKIAKKNKDPRVREKVLFLLDSWQEAFGGPTGKYPQYFLAYDELRRMGVIFPQDMVSVPPIFTPPQSHPIASNFPSPPRSPTRMQSHLEASQQSELPALSLAEMQTVRSAMEVLVEMLSAVDPRNKLALKDEVIMELVEQCHAAEQRVVQLVNSTSDEELLRQGLSLNDDLKKVLARHKALATGGPLSADDLPSAPSFLVDHNNSSAQHSAQQPSRSTLSVSQASNSTSKVQLALPPPEKPSPPPAVPGPTFDLLSGDTYVDLTPTPVTAPGIASAEVNNSPQGMMGQQPLFGTPSQQEQSFIHANGMVSGGELNTFNQQSQFSHPADPAFGQLSTNTYVASWSQPSGTQLNSQQTLLYGTSQPLATPASRPILSPQQQALIYGTEQNALQQALSSQQQALMYGADQTTSQFQRPQLLALPSPPLQTPNVPQQVYGSHLPMQQGYEAQQQQALNAAPYLYSQMDGVSNTGSLGFGSPRSSRLPPAPWSTENEVYEPSFAQPTPQLYGQPMPGSSMQSPPQTYFYPQQQFTTPILFLQAGLAGQMQNLSLQGGGYHPTMQAGPTYFERPGVSMKAESKPEDRLFKDLVDLAKTTQGGSPTGK